MGNYMKFILTIILLGVVGYSVFYLGKLQEIDKFGPEIDKLLKEHGEFIFQRNIAWSITESCLVKYNEETGKVMELDIEGLSREKYFYKLLKEPKAPDYMRGTK